MYLETNIYNEKNYRNILNSFDGSCSNNYYTGVYSKEFFQNLLIESNYHCYYCGHSLVTNSENGIYFEKEHIINKKNNNTINEALNKCKYNLIPICKTCNSKKIYINISDNFASEIKGLETNCPEKKTCNIDKCKQLMEIENFDQFQNHIKFDILHKMYINDTRYVSQFDLNKRTSMIFLSIFDTIYNMEFTFQNGEFIAYIKKFSNNVLDDEFIGFLEKCSLIGMNGTINTFKIDNLIETITLLEELE